MIKKSEVLNRMGFLGGSVVKNPPANAYVGSIPGSGRSPGEGNGTHSSILAWEIPWTEEPGGLQSVGSQRVRHNLVTEKSESEVAQLCPTLCDPMDCSLPGSSVHGVSQAIVLEWIAISFSRGSSQPRDQTQVSRIADRRFTV